MYSTYCLNLFNYRNKIILILSKRVQQRERTPLKLEMYKLSVHHYMHHIM